MRLHDCSRDRLGAPQRLSETFKLVFHCLREDLELVKEGKCRRRQNHSGFPETIVAILKMATASVLRAMTREKYVVLQDVDTLPGKQDDSGLLTISS